MGNSTLTVILTSTVNLLICMPHIFYFKITAHMQCPMAKCFINATTKGTIQNISNHFPSIHLKHFMVKNWLTINNIHKNKIKHFQSFIYRNYISIWVHYYKRGCTSLIFLKSCFISCLSSVL